MNEEEGSFKKPPYTIEILFFYSRIVVSAFICFVLFIFCLTHYYLIIFRLSILDHSCKPDAFIVFNGTKAALRSLNKNITEYNDNVCFYRVKYFAVVVC